MKLRPYHAADESALVDVWIESWRSVGLDRPVVTRADLAARVPRELAGRWTVTVAEADGRLVGFLAVCLAEKRLDQLFIHPSFHGRGIGSALFDVARKQLPSRFWLSTQAANRRAREFYELRGMALDRVEKKGSDERASYVSPGWVALCGKFHDDPQ